jgi:predicted metal-dependent enzyme (double-stranded beta helix superfamily)
VFDVKEFVEFCKSALALSDAQGSIAAELQRIVSNPGSISAPPPDDPNAWVLHRSESLSVLHTSYPKSFHTPAHDHGAWAIVSVYRGYEKNVLYERKEAEVEPIGQATIRAGEVVALEPTAIHDLATSPDERTCSIHVYGGDLFSSYHSMWLPPSLAESSYDQQAFRLSSAELTREARAV